MPEDLVRVRNYLNVHGYVELYNDERRLNVALVLGLFGEEGVKEINAEFSLLTPEEQCAGLNEWIGLKDDLDLDDLFS